MAHLNEQDTWEAGIYQIEQSDPVVGGANGIANLQPKQLANRTLYLKGLVEGLQASVEAVGIDGQNALASGMLDALARIGLLSKEAERTKFARHQEGGFTICNRGIKNGCELSKSTSASRNLSISAGLVFMGGRQVPVIQQKNAVSVPANSGSQSGTAQVYIALSGNAAKLGCTALNDAAPADALVLAELAIPKNNNSTNDPHLANVTITTVARVEPEWPDVQRDPAYAQVNLPRLMHGDAYEIMRDVTDYAGSDSPFIQAPAADRANNTFRAYLIGTADNVRVRYVAHLMDQ